MDATTPLVILGAVAAVLVVALIVFLIVRRRRQQRLTMAREEYGPEYQRLAEERGSEEQAKRELRERREKVGYRVRPLSEESRERYDEEWRVGVEQTFVND
jgi:flagellar biosynthesis/type III secretory pathway M-ring protein FliF/YscJ